MARLFEERERAAEGRFAHDEEARFVAHRRAIDALGAWAGETMELEPAARAAYRDRLVDAFVTGIHETEIIAAVQTDLERAGKPTLSSQVSLVLSQAIAEATAAAYPPQGSLGRDKKDDAHPSTLQARKPTVGWSL